jgi:hypothetical protein
MGPWVDVTLYDVAARVLSSGGVLYRDVFDTNLPGMVWMHAAIRAVFGWDDEWLRLADLGVVSTIAVLVAGVLARAGVRRPLRIWMAVALYAFYFSLPTSSHVQRDVWMLAPSLAAVSLRLRRWASGETGLTTAFLEGVCWGAAFWIKPFVLVPAAACWWLTMRVVPRSAGARAQSRIDTLAVLAGSLAIGVAGAAWLGVSGAWPYFWEVMLEWNPEYVGNHAYHWHARRGAIRLWTSAIAPWQLAPIAAIPIAVRIMRAALRRGWSPPRFAAAMLATFYLAWLGQALLIQPRPHWYVMDSATLVSVPLVIAFFPRVPGVARGLVAAVFAAFAALYHPMLKADRLRLWPESLVSRSLEIRDRVTLPDRKVFGRVMWSDLDKVASYLRSRDVGQGDLLCLTETTVPLYLTLDITPPLRYLQFYGVAMTFTRHRDDILEELQSLRPRFIVADILETGVDPDAPLASIPPQWQDVYPWNLPPASRVGQYLVFQANGPATRFWPDE